MPIKGGVAGDADRAFRAPRGRPRGRTRASLTAAAVSDLRLFAAPDLSLVGGSEDGRCVRCGRPVQPDVEYFDTLESLDWDVVNAAYDEYGDGLRAAAESVPSLQRVIVELANSLRHYHYDGDGCLDPE